MNVIKEGGHRLFEEDPKTTTYVSEMLRELEKNGMDAVRKYSKQFDDWDPENFELSESQIEEAISKCEDQLIQDTDFCQSNVRKFAEAQRTTMLPLEVEIRPGVIFGTQAYSCQLCGKLCSRRKISDVWLCSDEYYSGQSR